MTKWIIITPQGPPGYGPYDNEIEILEDITKLRDEYGHTEAYALPIEEAIDWQTIAYLDNGNNKTQKTREILAGLFPTIGITLRASEVREILEQDPDGVSGSHLHAIRKEMGIISRPVRVRGYSGVKYWEWTREPISDKAQSTKAQSTQPPKKKKKRKKKSPKPELTMIQTPQDPNIWVEEDRMQEYLEDPDNYTGDIDYTEGYR